MMRAYSRRARIQRGRVYPIGIKVSDEDMDMLNITRDPFHGDWNYTIQPQQVVPLFQ